MLRPDERSNCEIGGRDDFERPRVGERAVRRDAAIGRKAKVVGVLRLQDA